MTPDHVDRILATIRARFDRLDARLVVAESKIDQLILKLSWAEERIAASATTDTTGTLIEGIDRRIGRLEQALGRLSSITNMNSR